MSGPAPRIADVLKARIADVLKAHHWWFVGNLGVPRMADRRGYECSCGWSTGDPESPDFEDPHAHVADAILEALGPPPSRRCTVVFADSDTPLNDGSTSFDPPWQITGPGSFEIHDHVYDEGESL